MFNSLSSLDLSQAAKLEFLSIGENDLSSLDISNCNSLGLDVDIYDWSYYYHLNISDMPTLGEVCVWTMPFPPEGLVMDMDGSPNVLFTNECSR